RCAAPKREHTKFLAHEIQGLPQRTGMCVWAEIAAAVVFLKSGEAKARPFFRKIDSDHEEPLVVAERNVITRPVFLYQFALEQNRFRVAANGVRFKIPCRVEHGA